MPEYPATHERLSANLIAIGWELIGGGLNLTFDQQKVLRELPIERQSSERVVGISAIYPTPRTGKWKVSLTVEKVDE